jgi:adenosylcobyric acid synthase
LQWYYCNTDFNPLEHDERVHLYYTNQASEIAEADIVIIPGTKNTLHDLQILRRDGLASAILQAHKNGKTVLGICGGFQILGRELLDPLGMESDLRQLPGLNLLPISTTLEGDKITKQVNFKLRNGILTGSGYEIHNGRTDFLSEIEPLAVLENGATDGCVAEKCFGTYIHGILDNAEFVELLIQPFLIEKTNQAPFDYCKFKEEQFDKLAEHVRKYVNMELIYEIMSTKTTNLQ